MVSTSVHQRSTLEQSVHLALTLHAETPDTVLRGREPVIRHERRPEACARAPRPHHTAGLGFGHPRSVLRRADRSVPSSPSGSWASTHLAGRVPDGGVERSRTTPPLSAILRQRSPSPRRPSCRREGEGLPPPTWFTYRFGRPFSRRGRSPKTRGRARKGSMFARRDDSSALPARATSRPRETRRRSNHQPGLRPPISTTTLVPATKSPFRRRRVRLAVAATSTPLARRWGIGHPFDKSFRSAKNHGGRVLAGVAANLALGLSGPAPTPQAPSSGSRRGILREDIDPRRILLDGRVWSQVFPRYRAAA